jgi:hypothetical protein
MYNVMELFDNGLAGIDGTLIDSFPTRAEAELEAAQTPGKHYVICTVLMPFNQLFDVRLIDRYIRQGVYTRADYNIYAGMLKDTEFKKSKLYEETYKDVV